MSREMRSPNIDPLPDEPPPPGDGIVTLTS